MSAQRLARGGAGESPADLPRRVPAVLRVALLLVVAVELAVIAWGLGFGVLQQPAFSPIDEHAHLDYALHIARDHELPVLADAAQPDVRAAVYRADDVAEPSPVVPPGGPGSRLVVFSYEAFQPPLYYLLAAPVLVLGDDHGGDLARDVRLLRLTSAACVLAALPLLGLLARAAAPAAPLLAFAAGLVPLTAPGPLVLLSGGTNQALALPLTVLLALGLVRVARGAGPAWVLGVGLTLGALLLTRTTSVALAPLVAVVVAAWLWPRRRHWYAWFGALAAGLFAAVMVAPWLAFNLEQYGSLTANDRAQQQQLRLGFPSVETTFADLVGRTDQILREVLLPEQDAAAADWVGPSAAGLVAGLVAAGLVVAVLLSLVPLLNRRGRPATQAVVPLLLVAPFFLLVGALVVTTLQEQLFALRGRYLVASVPLLGVAAATALAGLPGLRRRGHAGQWAGLVGVVLALVLPVGLTARLPDEICDDPESPCAVNFPPAGEPPFALAPPGEVVGVDPATETLAPAPDGQGYVLSGPGFTARARIEAGRVRLDPFVARAQAPALAPAGSGGPDVSTVAAAHDLVEASTFVEPLGDGRLAVGDAADATIHVASVLPDGGAATVDEVVPVGDAPVAAAAVPALRQLVVALASGEVAVVAVDPDTSVVVQRFPAVTGATDVAALADGTVAVLAGDPGGGRALMIYRRPDVG